MKILLAAWFMRRLIASQAEKGVGWMPVGPKAEEGRGERRNVTGELQASVEPVEPEWGNPRPCERADRALNA